MSVSRVRIVGRSTFAPGETFIRAERIRIVDFPMTDDTDRPFSRLYAQLLEAAGEEVPESDRTDREPLGIPKVANPRPGSDADRT